MQRSDTALHAAIIRMQPPSSSAAYTSVDIPVCTYRYREIPEDIARCPKFRFRLESVTLRRRTVQWSNGNIERSTLMGADLAQLQLFNDVYIEEANAASLCFEFVEASGEAHTYTPLARTARLVRVRPANLDAPQQRTTPPPPSMSANDAPVLQLKTSPRKEDADLDTFYAASVYTLMHEYVQTGTPNNNSSGPPRFFHVGATLVPCSTLFVPLWLNDRALVNLLGEWRAHKLPHSKTQALFVTAGGESAMVQSVLPRDGQKRHVMELAERCRYQPSHAALH